MWRNAVLQYDVVFIRCDRVELVANRIAAAAVNIEIVAPAAFERLDELPASAVAGIIFLIRYDDRHQGGLLRRRHRNELVVVDGAADRIEVAIARGPAIHADMPRQPLARVAKMPVRQLGMAGDHQIELPQEAGLVFLGNRRLQGEKHGMAASDERGLLLRHSLEHHPVVAILDIAIVDQELTSVPKPAPSRRLPDDRFAGKVAGKLYPHVRLRYSRNVANDCFGSMTLRPMSTTQPRRAPVSSAPRAAGKNTLGLNFSIAGSM